jgi:hypothetical protein
LVGVGLGVVVGAAVAAEAVVEGVVEVDEAATLSILGPESESVAEQSNTSLFRFVIRKLGATMRRCV